VPPGAAEAISYTTAPTSGGVQGGQYAEALAREIRRHFSGRDLVPDGRLAILGARCAHISQSGGKLSSGEIERLAREAGLVGPVPLVVLTPLVDGNWLDLEHALTSIPANVRHTHFGAFVEQYGAYAVQGVVVLESRHLTLAPVVRSVEPNARLSFSGKLDDDYGKPYWAWTRPDGSTKKVPLPEGTDLSFTSEELSPGVHRFEAFATGPGGLEVIANIPVSAGAPSPRIASGEPRVDESDPARALVELINHARAVAGLAPVARTPVLDRIAQEHSEDMVAEHFFGHVSPTKGDPAQRFRASGIRVGRSGENVGRAASALETHRLLMDSPGHRDVILTPQFTHVGIGVVVEREATPPVLSITEEFSSFPSELADPAAFTDQVLVATNHLRATAGLSPLSRDPTLDRRAAKVSARFAARPDLRADDLKSVIVNEDFKPHAKRRVRLVSTFPATPDEIEGAEDLMAPRLRTVGIGVAQTAETPDRPRSNVVVFVVLD
jgi:uncharacterized protein YkwD